MKARPKEEPKRGLFLFCRRCDRTTAHERLSERGGVTLRCCGCEAKRAENSATRVRNAFGDKGRGF